MLTAKLAQDPEIKTLINQLIIISYNRYRESKKHIPICPQVDFKGFSGFYIPEQEQKKITEMGHTAIIEDESSTIKQSGQK
jgi:hypothetical protein